MRDLWWLAGILEGEGTFGIEYGRHPKVLLRMTDEDVVRRAHEVASCGNVTFVRTPEGLKDVWAWQVCADAPAVMMTMYPMMGARRKARILECLTTWHESGVIPRAYRSGAWKKENEQLSAEGLKRCVRCLVIRSVADFYIDGRTNRLRGHCTTCH